MKRALIAAALIAASTTCWGAGLFRSSTRTTITNYVQPSTNTLAHAVTNNARNPFYMTSFLVSLAATGTNNAYVEKVVSGVTNVLFVASISNGVQTASYPLAIWPVLTDQILQVRHDSTNSTITWEVNTEYYPK